MKAVAHPCILDYNSVDHQLLASATYPLENTIEKTLSYTANLENDRIVVKLTMYFIYQDKRSCRHIVEFIASKQLTFVDTTFGVPEQEEAHIQDHLNGFFGEASTLLVYVNNDINLKPPKPLNLPDMASKIAISVIKLTSA